MATPLRINGISGNQHTTSEYVVATLRILGQDEYGPAEALITRELHIVDKLEANMLIGTDIMLPEKMDILLSRKILQIGTCNVDVPVQIRVRPGYQQHLHPVHAKATTVVPPYSIAMIPIHSLSAITATTQDFLFEPRELDHASLFSHVLNSSTEGILVKNSTSTPIKIPRNTRLGHLQELGVEQGLSASAFLATEHNLATLAERPPRQKRIGWFTRTVTMLAAAYSLQAPSSSQFEGTQSSEFQLSSGPSIPETVLPNGVTIYGTQESEPVHKLTQVVSEFPKLWEDTGTFVNIPEDEWMRIPLLSDWESRIPAKGARVYPLGTEDRKEVDKTFDELHKLRRMSWSKTATPFAFPVFVVWRTLPSGKRKGRVVVDLRPLNHMALLDAYPLPLQSDIIALAHSCPYITVLDCASFFYQWRVHPSDRHKLTVVSHRGQEHFNICVMGFKNSPAYVQHQIDILLHKYPWAKAYIDDVVIASKTLEEHIQHLQTLFQLFSKMNISINPSKAFIGYPSIRILGQHVDSLGLSTDAEKLEAIAKLQFPKTLKQLEIYLGLTGYLRQYVPFYAAVSGPLQDRKTLLLQKGPIAGPQRRSFASQTALLNPTEAERTSFEELQKLLSTPTYLVHYDPNRRLYADIDASKAFGMGIVVYHVKNDGSEAVAAAADCSKFLAEGGSKPEYPKKPDIEPIMFLSRRLSPAEHRYWPTELEVAGLVWCLRKIRHMAESSKLPVRIYTDHGASLGIAKQSSLETTSAERSNLRLVRASEYIQRFNIELCHKAGKSNTIPDALSRLASSMPAPKDPELDFAFADFVSTDFPNTGLLSTATATAYNFTATLAEMSDDFRQKLLDGYQQDKDYVRITEILDANDKVKDSSQVDCGQLIDTNKAALPFTQDENGLIWHTGSGVLRLCIPQSLVGEILKIAHTSIGHPGIARTYERAASSWYVRKLRHHVQEFVRHCPECLIHQTRRHSPYRSLQPIQSPSVPFHTITIDFILALPKTKDGYDCVMSVTCKFSKRVTLIPGKKTWSARQWAEALLDRLYLADWGLPKVILSDRDRKFLSEFWSALFTRLGVQLLYSTAYHPQTDGQSEKTNQTVEIMLRFFIATLEKPTEWLRCLP